ncbi:hypothetical protein JTB14_033855 [Gonioctena quinquepunctata]|nr:hypothetical protein JTB14_033855 [Gonioctena quinquepunctata]
MNSEQLYNRETDKIWQLHRKHIADKQIEYKTGIDCDFENDCQWTWRKDVANGFFITSGGKNGANETGPRVDAEKRERGSFLFLRLPLKSTEFHVTSPLLTSTILSCKLAVWIYQEEMKEGIIRIVRDRPNDNAQWLIKIIQGDNSEKWHKYDMLLGYSTNSTIILEVVPSENMENGATVAFDNIRLSQCYHKNNDSCMVNQYKCKNTQTCINMLSICDITNNTPYYINIGRNMILHGSTFDKSDLAEDSGGEDHGDSVEGGPEILVSEGYSPMSRDG